MTVEELRGQARDGDRFDAFTAKGMRLNCRWSEVRRGLFEIIGREGKSNKSSVECDVKGAPYTRVDVAAKTSEG